MNVFLEILTHKRVLERKIEEAFLVLGSQSKHKKSEMTMLSLKTCETENISFYPYLKVSDLHFFRKIRWKKYGNGRRLRSLDKGRWKKGSKKEALISCK